MFTQKELEIGAKRCVLEYIARNGFPIARIYSEEEALSLERNLSSQGLQPDLIVRADNAVQWDGFSGIFGSYWTKSDLCSIWEKNPGALSHTPGEFSLEHLIALARLNKSLLPKKTDDSSRKDNNRIIGESIEKNKEFLVWYCDGLRLQIPDAPLSLIQEGHSPSNALFQHPNNEELVVISINKRTVLYDRQKNIFQYRISKYDLEKGFNSSKETEAFVMDAIKTYDDATSLGKFSKDYTYEMEFGKDKVNEKLLVYQIRLFRKKETANFTLPTASGQNVVNFDMPIGITPKDGINLTHAPATFVFEHLMKKIIQRDYSNSIMPVYPDGAWDSAYPHAAYYGIKSLIYPMFYYTRDHGARESLMKVPLLQCIASEFNGLRTTNNDNITINSKEMYQKIDEAIKGKQVLRVFSDGRKGMIIIN